MDGEVNASAQPADKVMLGLVMAEKFVAHEIVTIITERRSD